MTISGFLIIHTSSNIMESECISNNQEQFQIQEKEVEKVVKRSATKEDILSILLFIKIDENKFLSKVVINPIKNDVLVEGISFNLLVTHNTRKKNLHEIYDYGGIRLLHKIINEQLHHNLTKYVYIQSKNNLENILDILGSIEIKKDNIFGFGETNSEEKYYIMDSKRAMDLLNNEQLDFLQKEKVFNKLIKEYILQKLQAIESSAGELTFKELINNINSNISYLDFCKLRETIIINESSN